MILKKLSVCYKQNCWIGLGLLFLILFVLSACNLDKHKSKYAGQENREIKSLSPNDIEELQKGAGWGLAKAAELNGVPGPAHLLELEDEINLTDTQKNKIQKIFNRMNAEAVALGKRLIQLELELNNDFSNRTVNQESLEKNVKETMVRELVVHLSNLQTPLGYVLQI